MVNLCHQQQSKLYIPVVKINYIPTNLNNLQPFHMLYINFALKQKNVQLLMAFFRHTIWPNGS